MAASPPNKDTVLSDVSRPTGCVPIRSFSSLTFPAHQAATVTAIMVSLHIRLPSRYFFAYSSVFCTILYVWWRLDGSGVAGSHDRVHDITPTHQIAQLWITSILATERSIGEWNKQV